MTYRPELDGIRAFAVLAVIGFHSHVSLAGGGWMGVDVFFVLSGYLITTILLAERRRTGTVALGAFYVRRLLRLYPALLLTLALGLLFHPVLGHSGTIPGYGLTAAASGLYVENFVWGLTGDELGRLGHTWSLAVEMQFYLLWPPVLVWLVAKKKPLLRWIGVGAGVSFAAFVLQSGGHVEGAFSPNYYLPWTRAFELLLGCGVAVHVLERGPARADATTRRWSGWCLVALIGVVVLTGSTYSILVDATHLVWQAPTISVLTALLLLHLHRVGVAGVGAVLAVRPLAALGRISYGVYLFHYPVIQVLRETYDVTGAVDILVVTLPISIGLAALSYRFVERPAVRLAARRWRGQPSVAGPASLPSRRSTSS